MQFSQHVSTVRNRLVLVLGRPCVAVWRARLYRRDGCLLRSCHTHSIDPPLDPSYSKLRHSPSRYVFVYNPPRPSPRNRHVVSHALAHPLTPWSLMSRVFRFLEFPITTLSGRIQTSRSPQSRNCSFCSAFYAEFVRTKRYWVGSRKPSVLSIGSFFFRQMSF